MWGDPMQSFPGGAAADACDIIEKSVLAFCGQAGLFPPVGRPMGQGAGPADRPLRVMAAVSGGADSMALLRILLALAPQLGLTVTACHVNHGLRGPAADRDEAFVRAQCAALAVPLTVYRAAEPAPAGAGEDWARQLRYGFLARAAADGALVATAHTQNDQAETLLFRLARGTGVHGAAGIPARRSAYIRPLLCLTRQDTEAYCRAAGQPWVEDETNQNDDYARNRLRHYAIPALETANEGAVHNLSAFCARMARLDAYLAAQADALAAAAARQAGGTAAQGPWALAPLQAADPLIRTELLYRLVAPVRDAEEKYVRLLEACVTAGSGAVQLRPAVRFRAETGTLYRETAAKAAAAASAPVFPLQAGRFSFPGGYGLEIRIETADFSEKTQPVHKKDLKNVADYAKIPMLSVLRTRMPGDVFRPAGRGGSKTLKKLQNEMGCPRTERWRQPLLADGGRVLWLWDCGFAEGLAPDIHTKQVLRILPAAGAEEEK